MAANLQIIHLGMNQLGHASFVVTNDRLGIASFAITKHRPAS